MHELSASKPVRPLDPSLKGNDLLAQTSLLQLVNNPNVQASSAAEKLEQQQNAHMLADTLGGPSQEEQAAQVKANPRAGKRGSPPAPPSALTVGSVVLAPGAASSPAASPTVSDAGLSIPKEQSYVASATDISAGLAIASVPSSSPVVTKIFFTGRSGVGKNFLAQLIGATVLEFNTPLVGIWTGPPPPPAVLGQLIAWANGTYDASAANTAERGVFVQIIRTLFGLEEFGTSNFLAKHLVKLANTVQSGIVAVTDVQTTAEFTVLKDAGFRHFHVAASQTTMTGRNKRQRDEKLAAHLDGQASELMRREPRGSKKPVIWSDPITASPCERFYTPEEFKAEFFTAPSAPIEGVDL